MKLKIFNIGENIAVENEPSDDYYFVLFGRIIINVKEINRITGKIKNVSLLENRKRNKS